MAMSEWSEKKRLIVTIAIMVVLNLGIGGFLWKVRGDWEVLDAKHKAISKEVDALVVKAQEKPELERKLTNLKRENEQREQMLPEQHEREKFIDVLADTAMKTNITQKSTTPAYNQDAEIQGLPEQNFKKDIWRVTYASSFKGLVEFLNKLEEHYHRFVRIENLRITAKGSGMEISGVKHDISFSVETFRYVRGQGVGF